MVHTVSMRVTFLGATELCITGTPSLRDLLVKCCFLTYQ